MNHGVEYVPCESALMVYFLPLETDLAMCGEETLSLAKLHVFGPKQYCQGGAVSLTNLSGDLAQELTIQAVGFQIFE